MKENSTKPAGSISRAHTILIVDDNPNNLKVISDYLSDYGFATLIARNGESAIQRAQYAQPDIILLDVMMPGMDGFETCRRLKADEVTAHIPVIFMTALTSPHDKIEGFEAGAVDYITKPLQYEEVMARVNTHLKMGDLIRNLQRQSVRLRRRNLQLRVASEVARDATAGRRRDDLLDRAVNLIRDRFGFYHVAIFLVDDEGEYASLRTASGESEHYVLKQGLKVRVGGEGIVGHVTGTGEARVEPKVAQPPLPETGAEMALPLRVGDRIIGALDVQSREEAAFDEADIRALQTLADQLAVAFEQVRLFEKSQAALAETKALYRVSRSLIAFENLIELLQATVDSVAEALPADRVTLYTLDMEARKVTHFVKGGPGTIHAISVPFDELWEGLTGWVLREAKPALSPQGIPDPRESPPVQQRRADTDCGAIIVVPLQYQDRMIGTMTAINSPDQRDFTQRDANLMMAMAGQAAVAIENARLYEEAQQEIAERKRAEAKLRKYRDHLEELVEERTAELTRTNERLQEEIAERAQAEEELKRSEQRYALAQKVASIGSWEWDIQSGDLYWSEQVEPMFGFADGEFDATYEAFLDSVHPQDRQYVVDAVNACIEEDMAYDIEHRIVWPDGTVRWVSETGNVFRDQEDNATRMLGIVQDITERKQAEAERESLVAELEAKNTELERFTYTVSHDLKSPLITIKGFLGFLKKDAESGNVERLEEDVARITDATEKMQQLLDELLELSRVGRQANPPEEVPLGELAREAIGLVSGRIAGRGVEVIIASGLPVVYGDRPRLRQVLENLIDNAVKYMGDQAEPRIEIGMQRIDGRSVFYVRDNGIGIESQYQDRVFDLFEKLDQSSEGTGIGLAIVKRIVEVHGGRIWVESEGAGKGSTFYFTIPIPKTDRPAQERTASAQRRDGGSG